MKKILLVMLFLTLSKLCSSADIYCCESKYDNVKLTDATPIFTEEKFYKQFNEDDGRKNPNGRDYETHQISFGARLV